MSHSRHASSSTTSENVVEHVLWHVPVGKIVIPRPATTLLTRPRLLAVLAASPFERVVLLSGPAGSGKTLLLADWLQHDPGATAWVSLDDADNDDVRLWTSVVAALRTLPNVAPHDPIHSLAVPGHHPSASPYFLAELGQIIESWGEPVRLVLDDVHELAAPDLLRGLAGLVRDRPPNLQLVLSSRSDPPIGTARLRLSGQLTELRAAVLAFSLSETRALVDASDLSLTDLQVQHLYEGTGGWAAGLRLTMMSMGTEGTPTGSTTVLDDLAGNDRSIADYLVSEVLGRVSVEVLQILQSISVVEECSAEQAIALSGRSDAAGVLDALESDSALVTSYGSARQWYRINPLLRSYLRADLRRRDPHRLIDARRRAANWLQTHGLPGPALKQARLSGDSAVVIAVLQASLPELLRGGEHAQVRAAIGALDDTLLQQHPMVQLGLAIAYLEIGDLVLADLYAGRAKEHLAGRADARASELLDSFDSRRAWTSYHVTGSGQAAAARTSDLRSAPGPLLDSAYHAAAQAQSETARTLAEAAFRRATAEGNGYEAARAAALLGMLAFGAADYRKAAALARQAERTAPEDGWRATEAAGMASMIRSFIALLAARPGESLRLLEPAAEFAEMVEQDAPGGRGAQVALIRGVAEFDLGHRHEGLQTLDGVRRSIESVRAFGGQAGEVAVLEYQAAQLNGRTDLARTVLSWAERVIPEWGDLVVMKAYRPAAISRFQAARDLLEPVLSGAVRVHVSWFMVDAWVLSCSIWLATGNGAEARRAALEALRLAERMDAIRSLAYAPAPVIELISRYFSAADEFASVVSRALTARRTLALDELPPLLTERELAVLAFLPTMRSVDEIADDLTVSLNTVKSHLQAVYGKLNVNSRRGAVEKARRFGLVRTPGDYID